MQDYTIWKPVILAFCICYIMVSIRGTCRFSLSLPLYLWAAASTRHCKHTFDALLPWIYSALFTQQIASHRLTRLGIQCLALCSKPVRPRERERERGRRAIWIGVWSIFKRFSRVLTWSDQKHPTGTGPCSHKERPLMPLPWLPCWPNPPHLPPAYAWLGAAT